MKSKQLKFNYNTIYTMLSDITLGMHYLNLRGFVHSDLSLQNFIISPEFSIKISDFRISSGEVLPANSIFRDPEIFLDARNKRSDIWSVGMVLSKILEVNHTPTAPELGSDNTTWFEESNPEMADILRKYSSTLLVFLAEKRALALGTTKAIPELKPFMEGCLRIVAKSRLSFRELIILLEEIKVKLNASEVRAFPVQKQSHCLVC